MTTFTVTNSTTLDEITLYVSKLKGSELVNVSRDLDIPGRSKLNVAQTREAIASALTDEWEGLQTWTFDDDGNSHVVAEYPAVPEYEETESQDEAERASEPAESDAERRSRVVASIAEGYRSMVARESATYIVPNRAAKRKAQRDSRLRNDGAPKGGWIKK